MDKLTKPRAACRERFSRRSMERNKCHLCQLHSNYGVKLISASHSVRSSRTRGKTKLSAKSDPVAEVCRLLFVSDLNSGIRFLADCGAQILIIRANEEGILKGASLTGPQQDTYSDFRPKNSHTELRPKKKFHAL